MRLAVLGSGVVGQTIAARCAELGHEVQVGTRDVAATMARVEDGSRSFADWAGEYPSIRVSSFQDAAAFGEVIVNATSGSATMAALRAAGEANLAGKVLIDITNPLDFSAGFPPTLTVKDTDSLGEQIQRAFPRARVVKSLNTLPASLMVDARALADGDHSVFVSGDDADAKSIVGRIASLTTLFDDDGINVRIINSELPRGVGDGVRSERDAAAVFDAVDLRARRTSVRSSRARCGPRSHRQSRARLGR